MENQIETQIIQEQPQYQYDEITIGNKYLFYFICLFPMIPIWIMVIIVLVLLQVLTWQVSPLI